MNRTKRFIALLLSFALVFVNAITAYATDVESTQSTALIDVENVEITSGAVYDLSANASAAEVLSLTEGTVYVEFESTSTQQHQSLFSVSNPTTDEGSMYRHLHIYITPSGTLGMELRNTDEEFKYTLSSDNVLTSGVNRIAFKADAAGKTYKLFANGQLVGELSKEDYKFISDISGATSIALGGTIRNQTVGYPFGGTISQASVFATVLSDEDLIALTTFETETENPEPGETEPEETEPEETIPEETEPEAVDPLDTLLIDESNRAITSGTVYDLSSDENAASVYGSIHQFIERLTIISQAPI